MKNASGLTGLLRLSEATEKKALPVLVAVVLASSAYGSLAFGAAAEEPVDAQKLALVDNDASEAEIALSLDGVSLSYQEQLLSPAAASIAVPSHKDFSFKLKPADGYVIDQVSCTADGKRSSLVADGSGRYTVSSEAIVAGASIKATAVPDEKAADDASSGSENDVKIIGSDSDESKNDAAPSDSAANASQADASSPDGDAASKADGKGESASVSSRSAKTASADGVGESASAAVIDDSMSDEQIAKVLEANDSVTVEAGSYAGKTLAFKDKTVRLSSAQSAKDGKALQIDGLSFYDCRVTVFGKVKVFAAKSTDAAMVFENSQVKGGSKAHAASNNGAPESLSDGFAIDCASPDAGSGMLVSGSTAKLSNVFVTASGSAPKGLIAIDSASFAAEGCVVKASGNQVGSNIVVGAAAKSVAFENCTVEANGASGKAASGIDCSNSGCTVTFAGGSVEADNNANRGFAGAKKGTALAFDSANGSFCDNGAAASDGSAAGSGLSDASLVLSGADGDGLLKANRNHAAGMAARSIEATGYRIEASGNGKGSATDAASGIAADGASSMADCYVKANDNGGCGVLANGAMSFRAVEIKAMRNGCEGLRFADGAELRDSTAEVFCNGANGAENDTAVTGGKLVIDECYEISLGNTAVASNASLVRKNSEVTANVQGESNPVDLYVSSSPVKGSSAKFEATSKGALSHHRYDWSSGETVSEPDGRQFGCVRYSCANCKDAAAVYVPTVRIEFNGNVPAARSSEVDLPEEQVIANYGTAIGYLFEPQREGYRFEGWFLNKACTGDPVGEEYRVETPSVTLYAKWVEDGGVVQGADDDESQIESDLDSGDESFDDGSGDRSSAGRTNPSGNAPAANAPAAQNGRDATGNRGAGNNAPALTGNPAADAVQQTLEPAARAVRDAVNGNQQPESISDDGTPLAEETIDDNETPLSSARQWPWLQYYVVAGVVLAAGYYAAVLLRRRELANALKGMENRVMEQGGRSVGADASNASGSEGK